MKRRLDPRFRPSRMAFLASAALLLGLAAGAASSYFPEFYHSWDPVVGGWSTYRVTDARSETADLTFSVVSEDAGQQWLELKTAQEGATAVAAFLVKGDPTDDANVLMVRAQDEGGPAMEIDKPTLERLRARGQSALGGQALPIGPTVGKLETLPDETLKVGGKSLKCRHLKVVGANAQTAEVWMNDAIKPFGLVKLVSGPEQVVLTDFGKSAKSAMKGPFMKMDVP